jgi:hypothetical protein
LGHGSTLSYLRDMAEAVLTETGLYPYLNPGLMSDADYATLRPVAASMGLMLETVSDRLAKKGGPHFRSPDKAAAARLEALEAAGRARIAFTTGLLIGIWETRELPLPPEQSTDADEFVGDGIAFADPAMVFRQKCSFGNTPNIDRKLTHVDRDFDLAAVHIPESAIV